MNHYNTDDKVRSLVQSEVHRVLHKGCRTKTVDPINYSIHGDDNDEGDDDKDIGEAC